MISAAGILTQERKITSQNLALVLVHDLLLARGIEAGNGPIKAAIMRHKTRLHSEFQRAKIKRGVRSDAELAQTDDVRAGEFFGVSPTEGILSRYYRDLVSTDPALRSGQHLEVHV